ncbi:glycosyltransferase family 39 protein [Sphingomonas sp. HF-S3]|uniref:Glycosyltransferase family 39 protein n=2 Tax=Sphingomonas rustica TaxID=3103142 RepID=A0ABV0B5W7_9SPHN
MLARMPAFAVLTALCAGLVSLLLAWATGGLSPSLINPDEGAHYVNSLFIGDWIRAGFPSPMAYAQTYYAHFPRLSIGHWPPGWYLVQSPVFALLRPSPLGALAISAVVAALPAGAIAWTFDRMGRRMLGLALALSYVALPLVSDSARYILLDQPVALAVALAAIAWMHASDAPQSRRFLLFALLAAAAVLIKGNGALIALVPAIDIALTGRWHLLRRPGLWIAAAVALMLVAPWYWLSFRISAGGFNYEPGLAYAALSLRANAAALFGNLGPAGITLALTGAVSAFRTTDVMETRIARLSLAVIASTLVFQAIVPAAIEPRYIAPMLPWMLVLIGIGLTALWRLRPVGRRLAVPAAMLAALPACLALASLAPKPDIGAPALGREMADTGGLWLVDGRAGGEGSLIAAAAYADRGAMRIWVGRASQWLSTSDFMGQDYRLAADTPDQVQAILDRLGTSGVVSAAERNALAFPHSRLLREAVVSDGYATSRRPFTRGNGTMMVARRIGRITPNPALIERNTGSANVGRMSAALD